MSRAGPVAVVGAGGHAKVVVATLQAAGVRVDAVFDDDPSRALSTILGVPTAGTTLGLARGEFRAGVIAVGDNRAREALAARLPGLEWLVVVHPAAVVHHSVRLGGGSVVFAGAILQPEAVVGRHCIVNTGATVDHDCTLGDFVHVAPGAHLAGGVLLEDGVLVGIGAAILPGRKVGRWATLGAGTVVTENVPAGATVVGIPARPLESEP